ncbi:MAG: SDR family oxidoreductase [Rhodococcus sp. (in: high G+C Gram-positive bacteria)]|uniref:SDR family oxidoreductase n=1 Tax=Rhodococcus sp. TaxID=1831 RepID=UPI003BAE82D4
MDKDVVVVIGVGGMGQAIARRVGSGRRVLLADFDEATLDSAADLLRGEGHDVISRAVDVSDRDSVVSLADTAAELGRVTHVAHTAGLSPEQAPTEAILRVDLLGVALVLDEFARIIAPGGAGVVIASMAGHMSGGLPAEQERALAATPAPELLGLPFLAPDTVGVPAMAYVLAKRANALRVQAAAGAWGQRGARINSISPGVISTPMGQQELAGESGQTMQAMVDMSPAKRLGTPDDIAAAAAFLLDPQAGFITGTDLLVDGGVVATIRTLMPAG